MPLAALGFKPHTHTYIHSTVFSAGAMQAQLVWSFSVKLGEFTWHPKKLELLDGCHYVRLEPYDYSLCKALAGLSGIPPADVKSRAHPSISRTRGYLDLVRIRNQQQATNVSAPCDPDQSPMRRLFGGAQQAVRQRRAAFEIAAMRQSPSSFQVEIPPIGEYAACSICMRRPVNSGDDVFINATSTDLTNMVRFLVASGTSVSDLRSKRTYASSGEMGVWKNGSGFYKTINTEDGRKRYKKCEAQVADDAVSHAEADEAESEDCEADEAEVDSRSGANFSLDDLPAEDSDA